MRGHAEQRWSSHPMSRSSCACSFRRTTLMVFTPRSFAMAMSWRPSVEPAAPCRRYSPVGTFSVSRKPYAVTAHAPELFSGLEIWDLQARAHCALQQMLDWDLSASPAPHIKWWCDAVIVQVPKIVFMPSCTEFLILRGCQTLIGHLRHCSGYVSRSRRSCANAASCYSSCYQMYLGAYVLGG